MKHSEETKKKLSEKRKKYLKENPDKHPWKRHDKFKSVPCELVKKYLTEKNISYIDEWCPLENKNYSIDIAFPDIKYGIEINGNQHYNRDGTLKEYYQKRHDEIVKSGWTLIELHYSVAWNLQKFDEILKERIQPDYTEYFKQKEERHKKEPVLARGVKYSQNKRLEWKEHIKIVENCSIDFTRFGWGVELSKILGISPQKSTKWMQRYFPDVYENTCFKKKMRG